jgi:hypothetical protein
MEIGTIGAGDFARGLCVGKDKGLLLSLKGGRRNSAFGDNRIYRRVASGRGTRKPNARADADEVSCT